MSSSHKSYLKSQAGWDSIFNNIPELYLADIFSQMNYVWYVSSMNGAFCESS